MTVEESLDLPLGFSFLAWGGGRYTLVNNNSGGHRSQWNDKHDMLKAAWDWWYDVKNS